MIIYSVWGNLVMLYHITILHTGVAFSRQVSRSLISVAMETKGTITTLLHSFDILAKYITF